MNFLKNNRSFLICCCLLFLFFFRARYGLIVYSSGDDSCYVTFIHKWLGYDPLKCEFHSYAPGGTVLWLPAGLLAILLSKISVYRFDEWLAPLVGLSSFLIWAITFYFLNAILINFKFKRSLLASGCFLVNVPLLYYATHRTTLVHTSEFLFGVLTLYFMQKRSWFLAFLFAFWMTFTRYNDVFIVALVAASFLELKRESLKKYKSQLTIVGIIAAFTLFGLGYMAFVTGYNRVTINAIFQNILDRPLSRPLHVVFGADFGLLYTGTIWLVSMVVGIFKFRSISFPAKVGIFWIISNFLLLCGWGGHGSDYGYRYIIGSYIGVLILWLEWLRSPVQKLFRFILCIGALWSLYLTWVFKTNEALTLKVFEFTSAPNPNFYGGWVNENLQLEALKALMQPSVWLKPIGLSPLPTLLFSTLFKNDLNFSKYALSGPNFYVLSFASTVALGLLLVAMLKFRVHIKKSKL